MQCCLELSEDMALNNSDRDWIRQTIEDSHRLKGWPRVAKFAREWSLPGVSVALLIFVLVQWAAYTEFRTKTQDRLDQIEAGLRELRAPIEPRAVLYEMSRLDPKRFAQSLPALRKAQEHPVSDVQPQELQLIADKLRRTDPETPDYWPTVLQFLHFATTGITTGVPPPGPPTLVTSTRQVTDGFDFNGARVLLDGGYLKDVTISNSRVVFTENRVVMENVRFINCVFDLPATNTPNQYLRDAAKIMLASSPGSVEFRKLS